MTSREDECDSINCRRPQVGSRYCALRHFADTNKHIVELHTIRVDRTGYPTMHVSKEEQEQDTTAKLEQNCSYPRRSSPTSHLLRSARFELSNIDQCIIAMAIFSGIS